MVHPCWESGAVCAKWFPVVPGAPPPTWLSHRARMAEARNGCYRWCCRVAPRPVPVPLHMRCGGGVFASPWSGPFRLSISNRSSSLAIPAKPEAPPTPFRATPLNRKMFASVGEVGVPRVAKRETTGRCLRQGGIFSGGRLWGLGRQTSRWGGGRGWTDLQALPLPLQARDLLSVPQDFGFMKRELEKQKAKAALKKCAIL